MKLSLVEDMILKDNLSYDEAIKILTLCNKKKAVNHIRFWITSIKGGGWSVRAQSRDITVKFLEHPEDFIIDYP